MKSHLKLKNVDSILFFSVDEKTILIFSKWIKIYEKFKKNIN